MNLCRVVGSVVASEKHAALLGRKLMIVQPVDERLQLAGKSFIAVDHSCSAGEGDLVLVVAEGSGARQVLQHTTAPIRTVILGVVDDATIDHG